MEVWIRNQVCAPRFKSEKDKVIMGNLRKKIHFLLIDPQQDFASSGSNGFKGSLYVGGADQAMERVAQFVDRIGQKLEDIHVTMDSHQVVHIANPIFWKNAKGDHPAPFTIITSKDMLNGTWTTQSTSSYDKALKYLLTLENSKRADGTKRYEHTIWPVHCEIGQPGWNLYPAVGEALRRWQEQNFATVNFVTKGSNPWTEHFSAVRAEVPDPGDPASQVNTKFLDLVQNADEVVACGIAGDICFLNTIEDIYDLTTDKSLLSKFVLLTDGLPSIDDKRCDAFIDKMVKLGMRTSTTTSYLV
jgi:nicotinamidase/pyrazinamidase